MASVAKRVCGARNQQGDPCGQPPLLESAYCFWHDPETAEEAKQARRLGGQRRKREKVLQGIYNVGELDNVADLRRVLQIAIVDTLGLDNGIQRNRTLGSLVLAGTRLLEVGELADRVAELEAAMAKRPEPLKAVAGGRR
jgi:hypothetical protein